MALINYVEPFNAGELLAGFGVLIFLLVMTAIIYRLFKVIIDYLTVLYNRESKYEILEEQFLNQVAAEKGIDLDKELLKRNIIRKERKSFRRKIEDDIYEKMFGKEKEGGK